MPDAGQIVGPPRYDIVEREMQFANIIKCFGKLT
jgi:hypothetical protein